MRITPRNKQPGHIDVTEFTDHPTVREDGLHRHDRECAKRAFTFAVDGGFKTEPEWEKGRLGWRLGSSSVPHMSTNLQGMLDVAMLRSTRDDTPYEVLSMLVPLMVPTQNLE